jgi:primosomal protein N' (replication factor Y) (superfamily II helicase)
MMARVVIVGSVGALERLTYSVPADLVEQLAVGHRVLVPLRSRRVTAIVTEIGENLDTGGAVPKAVSELLEPRPLFDRPHLQLIDFLASYYLVPVGDAFRNVLPSLARVESQTMFRIHRSPSSLAQAAFTAIERRIFNELTRRPMTRRQLYRFADPVEIKAAIGHLMADGWITSREATRGRHRNKSPDQGETGRAPKAIGALEPDLTPLTQMPLNPTAGEAPELSSEQLAAISAIAPAIHQRQFKSVLLWGVTASGKSEVYLGLASEALAANRQVLVLVPEIALADQLVDSFRKRFGPLAALAHSAQNITERWASWVAALNGEARIMIGPRSAIFAPINDLGLIVVDEEHDGAYKQEEGIRYNARDLAVALARFADCPVVLGSATPSAESYANGRRGRYQVLQLTKRVQQREFARVEIIDLRQHRGPEASSAGAGADSKADHLPLSPPLIEALRDNLAMGGQSLVFLNRRGYHNFLQCKFCGTVITCASCSVSMTFHLRGRILRCHYCGASEPAPDKCFECGGFGLEGQGFGTERLVQALAGLFPTARIERMDSDTSRRRGARAALLQGVRCGDIDILVGTQMITKGLDFHNVTLVAVVLADLSLNLPDFRSAERTFQLLTQAAGRAGRGERPGRVLIQTYAPHHYSIRAAREQDYARFIRREMELRRELMYPPFARVALIRVEGDEPASVSDDAAMIAMLLAQAAKPEGTRILGPAPAPIERIKRRYRWQVMVKSRERNELRAALAAIAAYTPRENVRVSVDIDPVNML